MFDSPSRQISSRWEEISSGFLSAARECHTVSTFTTYAYAMKKNAYCGKCGAYKIVRPSGARRCQVCTTVWSRAYYHRSSKRRSAQRRSYLWRTYGISLEEIEQIFEAQRGRCAICQRYWKDCKKAKNSRYDDNFLQYLYVDHDHRTETIRGLLCNQCNCAIAFLEEDEGRLPHIKAYLRLHNNGSKPMTNDR